MAAGVKILHGMVPIRKMKKLWKSQPYRIIHRK